MNRQPDLEIRIAMTKEGLQVEVTNTRTGAVERSTSRWQDLFEE